MAGGGGGEEARSERTEVRAVRHVSIMRGFRRAGEEMPFGVRRKEKDGDIVKDRRTRASLAAWPLHFPVDLMNMVG